MLLLLLLSPCLSSRIQEKESRIQEARSQEAILVVGGSVGGAEDQQDSRTTELLLADCPVADLPRVRQPVVSTLFCCATAHRAKIKDMKRAGYRISTSFCLLYTGRIILQCTAQL